MLYITCDIIQGCCGLMVKTFGWQSFDRQFVPYPRSIKVGPLWCSLGCRSRSDGRIHHSRTILLHSIQRLRTLRVSLRVCARAPRPARAESAASASRLGQQRGPRNPKCAEALPPAARGPAREPALPRCTDSPASSARTAVLTMKL